MTLCANIAATLHDHLCRHDWHGYTQGDGRWGDGEGTCSVWVDGQEYTVNQGDRDCSSSIIECWKQAIKGTAYEGKLDAATYTGNMRQVFVDSGLFTWHPMSDGYIAQRGDIYLNEQNHTAMCQSAIPDMLSEFFINEHGQITGGLVGDQTGSESLVRPFYDFPWDGILEYNGNADDGLSMWIIDDHGWRYTDGNGKSTTNAWKEINGHWYYFGSDKYALTGWQYIKGEWYYLATEVTEGYPECAMVTGWLKNNNKWYYLKPSGAMASSCTMDIDGKTYAFNKSGELFEGFVPVDASGALVLN